MTDPDLFQENITTFKQYSVGDKLTIEFKGSYSTELGTLAAFGYDANGRLILGIQMVTDFLPRDQVDIYLNKDAISWYHPYSPMCVIKKVSSVFD